MAVAVAAIFDNAPDEASVRRFLPPAGLGWVIITSQSQHWPGRTVLNVPVLHPEVAAQFLMSRSGDPDQAAALELAEELGSLPLALEQAAAYTEGAGMSMAAYLSLLQHHREDLLARGEPAGHASVAATLSLAMARLKAGSPVAVGLLRLLAILGTRARPYRPATRHSGLRGCLPDAPSIALASLLGDPVALADAIVALRRFSLVSLVGQNRVLVHRLIQQHTTKDSVDAGTAREWEQTAALLVEAAVPDKPELPDAWPRCTVLLPHALAVLRTTSSGIIAIAEGLGYSGSYAVARDLFRQVATAFENDIAYGPHHPRTLAARHGLARWTGRAGDLAAARDQLAVAVPLCEQVLGPEHPETLEVRGNLAEWTGRAGDPAAARDKFAELVPIYSQVLGPEHKETLILRGNLATWTGRAGDAAGAQDQLADLLPIQKRVLGIEHPETLTISNNFAHWTGRAGNPAAARDQFAELALICVRILGPEHPDTLTIRGNVARWTGEAGAPSTARDLFTELLPIRERISGPEHPYTLIMRDNIARWTGEAGDPAATRDLYAELLPVYVRVMGTEHPDTRDIHARLVHWSEQAKRLDEPLGGKRCQAAWWPDRSRSSSTCPFSSIATTETRAADGGSRVAKNTSPRSGRAATGGRSICSPLPSWTRTRATRGSARTRTRHIPRSELPV